MHLTPTERDRVLVFTAAELARRRLSAGILLNVPESIALISDVVHEHARRGSRHVEAVAAGRAALGADHVLPDVPRIVRSVAVESVFADGSRLVVVIDPFGVEPSPEPSSAGSTGTDGEPPEPSSAGSAGTDGQPHESAGPSAGCVEIDVVNTADVAIAVTSHFHFFEVNPRLSFPRRAAYGMHLDLPAGTHVRFEPGSVRRVTLRPIRGSRTVIGFSGLVDGRLDEDGTMEASIARARACGFLDTEANPVQGGAELAVARALHAVRASAGDRR